MKSDGKGFDSPMRMLNDEELSPISGGVLTEEQKADCWEKAKRLKMFMRLEEFKEESIFDEERTDYIISIWDQVEVPVTLYTP